MKKKIITCVLYLFFAQAVYSIEQSKQTEIINWSAQAAQKLLSFSYLDNQSTYWAPYKNLFSQHGWKNFQQALASSNNIQTIKELKITAKITIDQQKATLITNKKNSIYAINLPAKITYAGENIASSYPAKITIYLSNNNGIKIENITTKQLSAASSKTIYPRGCRLRS